MSRLQKEVDRANQEVDQLESELARTGSTKTADDVKNELTRITDDLWVYLSITIFLVLILCFK